jgi:hypothetical protein
LTSIIVAPLDNQDRPCILLLDIRRKDLYDRQAE